MMEGVNEVGEVKMEEESEDKRSEHKVEDEKRKNMPHVLTSAFSWLTFFRVPPLSQPGVDLLEVKKK